MEHYIAHLDMSPSIAAMRSSLSANNVFTITFLSSLCAKKI